MEVVLTIPESVASEIQNGGSVPLSRRLLELAAIRAHEAELITERDVMESQGSIAGKSCMNSSRRTMSGRNTHRKIGRQRATAAAIFGQ